MNEIKLIQQPKIQHALAEVGKSVTKRLAELNIDGQVATVDTVKALKELRATLNKEFTEYEEQRKAVKKAITSPYDEMEAIFKEEITAKYTAAIDTLKTKIATVEDALKTEKRNKVLAYFTELCTAENVDFLKFESLGLEINLSTSEKQYKEKCNAFVLDIKESLELIDTYENKAEILVEYKRTLNLAGSIKLVNDRKEAERQEKERIRLKEMQRRQNVLIAVGMAFDQFTNSFAYDDDIYMTVDTMQALTTQEFSDKMIAIEMNIKEKNEQARAAALIAQAKEPAAQGEMFQQAEPIQQAAPEVAQIHAPKVAEPLSAPTAESTPENVTASFEVITTMPKLKALGQYMRENGITYKNI